MPASLKGRLLVSRPDLHDPNFDGTITLLVEHNDEGALGLVLNRPSEVKVEDLVSGWEDLAADPPVIFSGGPVEPNALLALGWGGTVEGNLPLGMTSVDLDSQPTLVAADGVEQLRVFVGYAGWGGGQLEGELAMGAWWLLDSQLGDVFTQDPQELWSKVLRRGGGEMLWYANMPQDPSLN